jgi:hypothetical protein
MKVILEIDNATKAGRDLMAHVEQIKNQKGINVIKEVRLGAKELAKGIGRLATPNELKYVMKKAAKGKFVDFDEAINKLTE